MADAVPVHSKKVEPTKPAQEIVMAEGVVGSTSDAKQMSNGVRQIMAEAAAVRNEPMSVTEHVAPNGSKYTRTDW